MGHVAGELFAGIDLAWSTGWTGVAVVEESGRVLSPPAPAMAARCRSAVSVARWYGTAAR